MNGQGLGSSAQTGWGSADFARRTEMALFDGLPPAIRNAVAHCDRALAVGEVLDEWATARRREPGLAAADFARFIY